MKVSCNSWCVRSLWMNATFRGCYAKALWKVWLKMCESIIEFDQRQNWSKSLVPQHLVSHWIRCEVSHGSNGLTNCPLKHVTLLNVLFIEVKILFKTITLFHDIKPNWNNVLNIKKTTKSATKIRFLRLSLFHAQNHIRSFAYFYRYF